MYYKIIKDGKIMEAIKEPTYVRASRKTGKLLLCGKKEASGILSDDNQRVWHLLGYQPFPEDVYETVTLVGITEEEYQHIKIFGGRTPEEIIDAYTLTLIEEGVL